MYGSEKCDTCRDVTLGDIGKAYRERRRGNIHRKVRNLHKDVSYKRSYFTCTYCALMK